MDRKCHWSSSSSHPSATTSECLGKDNCFLSDSFSPFRHCCWGGDLKSKHGRRRARLGRWTHHCHRITLLTACSRVLMLVKERRSGKSLRAFGTRILFHLLMGLEVRSKIGAIGECAMAVFTFKWLFPCVRPDMSLQKPWSRERLATDVAAAWKRVRAMVHLQSAKWHIGLRAVLAQIGTFASRWRRARHWWRRRRGCRGRCGWRAHRWARFRCWFRRLVGAAIRRFRGLSPGWDNSNIPVLLWQSNRCLWSSCDL